MPRSLLWRTFLLVALLLGLSVAAWITIFRLYEREPRSQQIANQVAAIVNLTRAALVSSRPENRVTLMREIAESESIEIYPVEPGETLEAAPMNPVSERIESMLRQKIGEGTRFAGAVNGAPGVWISFRIEDDEYWVRLRRERIEPDFARQWLGWGAAAILLALAGAWLIVWRINRPLKTLTEAARAVGRGETPAPVAEQGAIEIQTLARTFNQMTRDLKASDDNRALVLAGISHDLRTPLARQRLGVEMTDDATFKDGMVADIEQMDQIIGQFLEFARSGHEQAAAKETVNLALFGQALCSHYAAKGHDLANVATEESLEIQAHAAALRRAVMNLVENAIRYGGGEATLRLAREGRHALIEVLDRGPGIPAGERERLKQPFTRLDTARGSADGSVDAVDGGSGLGLAIVERIVSQHGGQFELAGRDGGGLIARIRIPLSMP